MKAAFYTLGCKCNQFETQAMERMFLEHGHEIVPFSGVADVYVINTCAVTNEAEKKSRQMIARCKKFNPNAKIFVCGCASQNNAEQFADKDVEYIGGVAGKIKIAEEIENYAKNGLKKEKAVRHELLFIVQKHRNRLTNLPIFIIISV